MAVKVLFQLGKGKISILASLSAVAGYILARRGIPIEYPLLGVCAGTFLLAMGACALNQYQERELDGKMDRTRGRPLPSGRISPPKALLAGAMLAGSGIALLFVAGGPTASFLGIFALLWYNGVYTLLKKASPFAALPGAFVGAVPPAIGWVSAGGSIVDPGIVLISFFFFIWQVPHFWLLSITHGGDYRKAGLPTPADLFSQRQLSRITLIWLVAAGVASLSFPLFRVTRSSGTGLLLAAGTAIFLACSLFAFGKGKRELSLPTLFTATNLYALLVIILISLDGILA